MILVALTVLYLVVGFKIAERFAINGFALAFLTFCWPLMALIVAFAWVANHTIYRNYP